MTSKLLTQIDVAESRSVAVKSASQNLEEQVCKIEVSSLTDRLIELTRSHYKANHQIEFMHLTAEADALLQQIQVMKQQRLTV